MTNFDYVIDRHMTACLKHEFATERGLPDNLLPLWVADMDFAAPPCVVEALHGRVSHGIFGYTDVKPDYVEACAGWFDRHFGWKPEGEWLITTPGVVFALGMAVRAYTEPGDAVLLTSPVYYPFYEVIRDNDRRIVDCPLREVDGRYELDLQCFEETIQREKPRLFLLCSPHNPVGRVWTKEELRAIGDICLRHGVIIASDEIHCDFTFPGHPHTPLLKACPECADTAFIATAPSKTFNIAGLQISNIWIPNAGLRERFRKQVSSAGYSQPNTLGLIAAQAAYAYGDQWHRENWAYLQDNLAFFRDILATRLPELRLIEPEGTYFAWVDFSGLGLSAKEVTDFVIHKARLWLDSGSVFGEAFGQYQRFVLASPRQVLAQALLQLEYAIKQISGEEA
ncbi:MAG: pyridoxal phosphate-dependent aminotransferase [Clostridia bacterium]|nr:pyridoxal phosphate-dependent aminotransferase [Clostridia bacterium]